LKPADLPRASPWQNGATAARRLRPLFRDLYDSLRNPEFWALSTWLDIVVRYRQSRLGILWLMAPPIMYVWGLGFFFAKMQGAHLSQFAAHVGLGYTIFRMINTVIIDSTTAFGSSSAFILDGHLRLTDFVLRVVARAMFYFFMALPILAIALWVFPGVRWEGLAMAAVTFPLIVFNLIWIGVVFALVGARFPDLNQFIGNVFLFAFLFTPIIWYADAMPAESVRGAVMRFNPLFHMVEVVRAPILGETVEVLTYQYLLAMTIVGWAIAWLLYRRYSRFVPLWI
jgi:ABC-type polysaccharide/polyol phosphate export permease